MQLTATHAAGYAGLATGAKPRGISLNELINLAGTHFAGMHPWEFYRAQSFNLHLRGDFAITSAAWTQATKNVQRFGAFAKYDFLEGDTLVVTAGTGLTLGSVPIASKTDADNIVLEDDIGPDAVDLAGTITIAQPELMGIPATVEEILGVDAVEGNFTRNVGYATAQEFASLKAQAWDATPLGKYYWNAVWIGDPALRWIEVYPTPTERAVDYFRVYARTSWVDIQTDDENINLPRYAQPLFLEVVRAFARGFMNPETQPLDEELERIAQSRLFEAAVRADSTFTPSLGTLGPGAASQAGGAIDLITSPIGGPVSP